MVPTMLIMFPVLILLILSAIALMVVFIKLCTKKPWLVAIFALLSLLLFAKFFLRIWRYNTARYESELYEQQSWKMSSSEDIPAVIWQPGIEDEFEADVYPSKISAVRSLGLRIDGPIRQILSNLVSPSRIILFQGAHERKVLEEFGQAISQTLPETQWTIEPETAAVQDDEIAIRLDVIEPKTQPVPWQNNFRNLDTTGTIQANIFHGDKSSQINVRFVEKPWVDNFSDFLNQFSM